MATRYGTTLPTALLLLAVPPFIPFFFGVMFIIIFLFYHISNCKSTKLFRHTENFYKFFSFLFFK